MVSPRENERMFYAGTEKMYQELLEVRWRKTLGSPVHIDRSGGLEGRKVYSRL